MKDARNSHANRAGADQANGSTLKFGPTLIVAVIGALPLSREQRGIHLWNAAQGGDDKPNRVFGRRRGVATGREANGDAVPGGRLYVRIHRTAPAHHEEFEIGRGGENLFCKWSHLGDTDLHAFERLDDLFFCP